MGENRNGNGKKRRPARSSGRLFFCLLLAVCSCLLCACASVPYTDRSRLMLTDLEYENRLGAESWTEVCSEEKESADAELTAQVVRVGKNIAAVSGQDSFQWEFKLFDSSVANAFCLPGGKVAVYSAIAEYMDNEAELAVVIGHEIAHAVARHGGERISQSILQEMGKNLLFMASGDSDESSLAAVAYGIVTEYGVLLPYSREHEYEADRIGMILMAKAGYDPSSAIVFWEKFGGSGGGLEFLSTHPLSENRIEQMRGILPEAMEFYQSASVKRGTGASVSRRGGQQKK